MGLKLDRMPGVVRGYVALWSHRWDEGSGLRITNLAASAEGLRHTLRLISDARYRFHGVVELGDMASARLPDGELRRLLGPELTAGWPELGDSDRASMSCAELIEAIRLNAEATPCGLQSPAELYVPKSVGPGMLGIGSVVQGRFPRVCVRIAADGPRSFAGSWATASPMRLPAGDVIGSVRGMSAELIAIDEVPPAEPPRGGTCMKIGDPVGPLSSAEMAGLMAESARDAFETSQMEAEVAAVRERFGQPAAAPVQFLSDGIWLNFDQVLGLVRRMSYGDRVKLGADEATIQDAAGKLKATVGYALAGKDATVACSVTGMIGPVIGPDARGFLSIPSGWNVERPLNLIADSPFTLAPGTIPDEAERSRLLREDLVFTKPEGEPTVDLADPASIQAVEGIDVHAEIASFTEEGMSLSHSNEFARHMRSRLASEPDPAFAGPCIVAILRAWHAARAICPHTAGYISMACRGVTLHPADLEVAMACAFQDADAKTPSEEGKAIHRSARDAAILAARRFFPKFLA